MEWYEVLLIIIGILLIVFLFFVLPGNPKKAIKHDWLYSTYIAHRGYFNNEKGIVENTKTAFLLAINKGFNIETDISLTLDNQIVVYHDSDFKRLFNLDKKISELTLKEIKELRYENSIILCEKAMEILKDYKGRYALQSFQPLIVSYFKKNYPFIPRGQLFMKFNLKEEVKNARGKGFKGVVGVVTKWMFNNKLTNLISRPMFIDHSHHNIDFMAKLVHLFVPLIVYTVVDEESFNRLNKKVDNIIFENLEIRQNEKLH